LTGLLNLLKFWGFLSACYLFKAFQYFDGTKIIKKNFLKEMRNYDVLSLGGWVEYLVKLWQYLQPPPFPLCTWLHQ